MAKPAAFCVLGLLFFFLSAAPILAAAPPLRPDKCPTGASTGNPTGSKIIKAETPTTEVEKYLQQIVNCPSACYDVSTSLRVNDDLSLTLQTTATDQCTPANRESPEKDKRGCDAGQTQPRIRVEVIKRSIEVNILLATYTVEIPEKKIEDKSRCDENVLEIATSALGKFQKSDTEGLKADLEKLAALPEATVAGPPDATLTSAVDQAFGKNTLTTEALREIEESTASDRIAELAKAGKYEEAAQVAATAKLSQKTISEIKALDASNRPDTVFSSIPFTNGSLSQNTFGSPPGSDPNGEWRIDPRGEPQYPVRNSTTRDGQLKTVISPEALGNIIEDRSETFCATVRGSCYASPEAFVATQMIETTGDVRVSGDGGNSQSLAQVYSAQSGFNTYLAQYKAAYGEDYMLHRVNLRDPSINPEWIASQSVGMQAVVLQDKGQNAGGNYARLVTGYNGSGAAAAAYGNRALNNTQLLQSGRADPYWQSVYNTAKEGGGPAITNLAATGIPRGVNSASPFGNVSPFTTIRPVGTAGPGGSGGTSENPITQLFSRLFGGGTSGGQSAPTGSQGGGAVPNQQPSQQIPGGSGQQIPQGSGQSTAGGGTSPSSPVQQLLDALGGSVPTPAVPVEAVASILVQPQEVERGGSLVVSWSSVGTSSSAPCHVILTVGTSTSVIAQGNEGTRSIQTSATTPTGGWDFRLRCTATIDGELLERNMSASVR